LRYSAKKLCALCGKKISLFLDRDVGSENQIYLSFDMPLREQRERETIKAKGFQEHRTFEGKAFEELACDNRGTKKVKTTEIRE
jgi:hypothetical protein